MTPLEVNLTDLSGTTFQLQTTGTWELQITNICKWVEIEKPWERFKFRNKNLIWFCSAAEDRELHISYRSAQPQNTSKMTAKVGLVLL